MLNQISLNLKSTPILFIIAKGSTEIVLPALISQELFAINQCLFRKADFKLQIEWVFSRVFLFKFS